MNPALAIPAFGPVLPEILLAAGALILVLYGADRITPVVARNATQVLARNAPIRLRNSPTNPEVPGRPTLASVKTMNTKA